MSDFKYCPSCYGSIVCRTHGEAIQLLSYLHQLGFKWMNGESLSFNDKFLQRASSRDNCTVYNIHRLDKKITKSNFDYFDVPNSTTVFHSLLTREGYLNLLEIEMVRHVNLPKGGAISTYLLNRREMMPSTRHDPECIEALNRMLCDDEKLIVPKKEESKKFKNQLSRDKHTHYKKNVREKIIKYSPYWISKENVTLLHDICLDYGITRNCKHPKFVTNKPLRCITVTSERKGEVLIISMRSYTKKGIKYSTDQAFENIFREEIERLDNKTIIENNEKQQNVSTTDQGRKGCQGTSGRRVSICGSESGSECDISEEQQKASNPKERTSRGTVCYSIRSAGRVRIA